MSVITISRDAGSLGDEIANQLAEDFGYKLLDPEKIKEILNKKGIKTPVIEQFDEKTPGFFSKFSEKKEEFLNYLSLSVFENCTSGKLVILGLGGQYMFSSQEALVRVRITASEEVRIERISEKYECDKAYAKKLINQVDHDREGYTRAFFGKDIHDPDAYDLLINTEFISIADAVKFIKDLCKLKDRWSFDFKDDYIRQTAVINILHDRKIPVRNLQVYFKKGVISLEGKVNSVEDSDLCSLAVSWIDGVEEVHNKIGHKVLNNYSIH